jgi:hypothetical protein
MNELLDTIAGGSSFHALDTFAGERQKQQAPCRGFINSSRLQIEKRRLLDLTDGCSVGTLHVVGIDFELRLGIDLGIVRKQQVPVRLLGIRLLRVFVHHDATMEDSMRMSVENTVVELTAAAMRTGVLDMHVVIKMLPSMAHKETVNQALAAFSG